MNRALLAFGAAFAFASAARAGETTCWYEQGVVVVPASVMGVAGDYILDTGARKTLLHETRAQAAGLAETELAGEVRLAGVTRRGQAVAVADLDARTVFLPTPIAGVIGADVLEHYVLDVSFAPCRVALHSRRAPAFGPAQTLPIRMIAGAPTVQASVEDGDAGLAGDFVVATGFDVSVRLDDRLASAPGAAKPEELYPGGVWTGPLAAASFAGDVYREVDAGLLKGEGDKPSSAGVIGAPVLSRYRLRFDFPRRKLLVARTAP